jgi:mRNA-degrading endonuclease RelE of RelBE toxin-antitoxin system
MAEDIATSMCIEIGIAQDSLVRANVELNKFATPERTHYGALLRKVAMILIDPINQTQKMLFESNHAQNRKMRSSKAGKYRILFTVDESGQAQIIDVDRRDEVVSTVAVMQARENNQSSVQQEIFLPDV